MRRLEYVRGRQSLSFLRKLLDETGFRATDSRSDGDIMYLPLAYSAVTTLAKIVDYPPLSYGEVVLLGQTPRLKDFAVVWKKWFARQEETPSQYLARIRSGDEEAFLDMGRRDIDQDLYRAAISAAIKDLKLSDKGLVYAHMALARLGEESAFQWLVKDVRILSPEEQYKALDRLRYARRATTIAYLRSLLDETDLRDNERVVGRDGPERYGIGSPIAFRAAIILSKMIYPVPVMPSEFVDRKGDLQALLEKWKQLLDELAKLAKEEEEN
jgi:hypothetical protein